MRTLRFKGGGESAEAKRDKPTPNRFSLYSKAQRTPERRGGERKEESVFVIHSLQTTMGMRSKTETSLVMGSRPRGIVDSTQLPVSMLQDEILLCCMPRSLLVNLSACTI